MYVSGFHCETKLLEVVIVSKFEICRLYQDIQFVCFYLMLIL